MTFNLKSPYKPAGDQPKAIKEIVKGFKDHKQQTLLGVTGSGKTFTIANIIAQMGKKTLVLAHNKTLAAQLYAELKSFFPENKVEYFVSYYDYYQPEAYVPSSDSYIEKDSSINEEIDKMRHSTTQSLLSHEDVIVVSSVSCIYGIGDPEEYQIQKLDLKKGQIIERDDVLKLLVKNQYQRNDIDLTRGTFRVRGDIVEIIPANDISKKVRIEFFDNCIDSISFNDPLTGKNLESLESISLYPASFFVVSEQKQKRAIKTIQEELRLRLNELKKENKLVEAQRLEQKTLLDLEMIEEMGFCSGIENYSRHFTERKKGEAPPTLIDFFGEDFLMIIDESHVTVPQIGAMYRGDLSRKQNLVDYGFRLPSALDNRPLKFGEFESKVDKVLYVSATPADYELNNSGSQVVKQIIRPTGLLDPVITVQPSSNQVKHILKESQKTIAKKQKVLITTLTKKSAEDLSTYFIEQGMRVRYLHSEIETLERIAILNEFKNDKFDILIGINLLREGLDLPMVSLVGILDADKEGFLRSERSLIQIIGRAARNEDGRVILYGNKTTKSMAGAIKETLARRNKQIAYNKKHKITPKTVLTGKTNELSGQTSIGEVVSKSQTELSPLAIENKIKELTKVMKKHSKNMNYEKAAQIRDEIKSLKELLLFC